MEVTRVLLSHIVLPRQHVTIPPYVVDTEEEHLPRINSYGRGVHVAEFLSPFKDKERQNALLERD